MPPLRLLSTSDDFRVLPIAPFVSCPCVDARLTRSSKTSRRLPPSPAAPPLHCLPMSTTRLSFNVYNPSKLTTPLPLPPPRRSTIRPRRAAATASPLNGPATSWCSTSTPRRCTRSSASSSRTLPRRTRSTTGRLGKALGFN